MRQLLHFIIYVVTFITFFLVTMSSCQKKRYAYRILLKDSIQYAIKSYVIENKVNIKSRVITTDWMVNPYRSDVYISNTSREFLNTLEYVPSYYSIVSDSILVLVYTGTEAEIIRNDKDIQMEIKDILFEKGIVLQPDDKTISHVKTWLYSSCSGKGALVREPSPKDLLYLSCRDSSE